MKKYRNTEISLDTKGEAECGSKWHHLERFAFHIVAPTKMINTSPPSKNI